jgi:hypothetical protein
MDQQFTVCLTLVVVALHPYQSTYTSVSLAIKIRRSHNHLTDPSFARQDARHTPETELAARRIPKHVDITAAALTCSAKSVQLHRRRECACRRGEEEYEEWYQTVGQERSDTSLGATAWYVQYK